MRVEGRPSARDYSVVTETALPPSRVAAAQPCVPKANSFCVEHDPGLDRIVRVLNIRDALAGVGIVSLARSSLQESSGASPRSFGATTSKPC
jgi:hypothetical protein